LAYCQHRSPTQLLSELLWKLLSSLFPISIPFAFFFIPLFGLFTHFFHLKKGKEKKTGWDWQHMLCSEQEE